MEYFFEKLSTDFTVLFKDVRDALMHYDHTIELKELIFYEKGLFKYGKLYETQEIADDVLRKIFKNLVCDDEKYIGVLKSNENEIIKIIDNAKESNEEFKKELESKCSPQHKEVDIKLILEKLTKRSQELEKEHNKE